MAKIEERVASLETGMRVGKWAIGILVPSLVLWGWYITTNVVAMKQSLSDGGNTKLVTELKSPQSPEKLRADLSTVTAQVQTAQAEHKQPDPAKISKLSNVVAGVVQRNPDLPEAWQAAASLVSYRAPADASVSSEICGKKPEGLVFAGDNSQQVFDFGVLYKNCTVILDDAKDILDDPFYKKGLHALKNPVMQRFGIAFSNVHVVYRGGTVLPADVLVFNHCTFEFQINVPPPLPARRITETLLAANNLDHVNVFLAGS